MAIASNYNDGPIQVVSPETGETLGDGAELLNENFQELFNLAVPANSNHSMNSGYAAVYASEPYASLGGLNGSPEKTPVVCIPTDNLTSGSYTPVYDSTSGLQWKAYSTGGGGTALPEYSETGSTAYLATSDGSAYYWSTVEQVPSYSGSDTVYLANNSGSMYWTSAAGGGGVSLPVYSGSGTKHLATNDGYYYFWDTPTTGGTTTTSHACEDLWQPTGEFIYDTLYSSIEYSTDSSGNSSSYYVWYTSSYPRTLSSYQKTAVHHTTASSVEIELPDWGDFMVEATLWVVGISGESDSGSVYGEGTLLKLYALGNNLSLRSSVAYLLSEFGMTATSGVGVSVSGGRLRIGTSTRGTYVTLIGFSVMVGKGNTPAMVSGNVSYLATGLSS